MSEEIFLIILVAIFVVVVFAIQIAINFFYYKCLNEVPEEHRTMQPAMVFLNLIPCLNIVWIFLVVNGISKSYQNFFATLDDPHVKNEYGDCAAGLGLAYAILSLLSAVPYLNCLSALPSLVVFVLLLLKYNAMRKFAQLANAMK